MTPALMEENKPDGNTESVPRSKFLSENQCSDGNNNTADSSDITDSIRNAPTSESNEDQTEQRGSPPVRLPPRPPAPSAEAGKRNSIYERSNPVVKPSEASGINGTMTLTASSSEESFSSIYKDLDEMMAALREETQLELKSQAVPHQSDGNNNMADSSETTVAAKNSMTSESIEDQTEHRGLPPGRPPPRPPAPSAEAVKRNSVYRRSNPAVKSSESNEDQPEQRGLHPVRLPPRPTAPSAGAVGRNSFNGGSNSYPSVMPSVATGTNRTMTLNSNRSEESFSSIYKDLDEMTAAPTEQTQAEVKAQSVPHQGDVTNNMADSSDRTDKITDSTTSESDKDPTEQRGLCPVRLPPRPPAPTAEAFKRSTIYGRSNPAVKAALMKEAQPELKSQAVPHRSDGNNNMADSSEIAVAAKNVTTSESNEDRTEQRLLHLVRPPLRPPAPSEEAVKRNSISRRSNPAVKPTALTSGQLLLDRRSGPERPLPPQRPPLPPIYCDRLRLETPYPDKDTDASQQSRSSSASSMEQAPIYSCLYEDALTYSANAVTSPVLQQPDLFDSPLGSELSPPRIRPPRPPSFNPQFSLPSEGSDSLYCEIESPTYVEILPDESEEMHITSLLTWLRKTSKKDSMSPSLYGLSIDEEMRSFNQRAVNVTKALHLYNYLMIKRKDNLKKIISEFMFICGTLDKIQKKNKTMSIAGGTTGAVGGMTAVMGIALAPATIGASLVATLVGAGMVASAGAMGAHAAKANKKIVDRVTVEKLLHNYKVNIVDLELCLHFILVGMNELRRHDIARLNRAGAEPEAVKMAHQSEAVFRYNTKNNRGTSTPNTSEKLLLAFAKEMDQYFSKKDVTLRKSTKSKFSGRICLLAENLQDEVNYLNDMWGIFSN